MSVNATDPSNVSNPNQGKDPTYPRFRGTYLNQTHGSVTTWVYTGKVIMIRDDETGEWRRIRVRVKDEQPRWIWNGTRWAPYRRVDTTAPKDRSEVEKKLAEARAAGKRFR